MTDVLKRLRSADPAAGVGGWSGSAEGRAVHASLQHRPRERRAWVVAAAAAFVILLISASTYLILRAGSSETRRVASDTSNPVPTVNSLADLTGATWHDLDSGPLGDHQDVLAAVWTGDELLVSTRSSGTTNADYYAYSPTTGTWRSVASAPITWRQTPVSLWTGSRWIIWGGSYFAPSGDQTTQVSADGATYDPTTDTWRAIPEAPIGGLTDASSVWTGTELIVTGGQAGCVTSAPCGAGIALGAQSAGAAYNPATNTWRTTAGPPTPVFANARPVHTAWDGRAAVFIGPHVGSIDPNNLVESYDPATDTWTTQTFPYQVAALTSTNDSLLGVSRTNSVSAPGNYQAVRSATGNGPFEDVGTPLAPRNACDSELQATGSRAIVIDCGNTARARADEALRNLGSEPRGTGTAPGAGHDSLYGLDTTTNAWTELPSVPSDMQYLFWTEHGLLGIGAGGQLMILAPEHTPSTTTTTSAATTTRALDPRAIGQRIYGQGKIPQLPRAASAWLRQQYRVSSIGRATSADWVLTTHGKAATVTSGAAPDDQTPVYLFDVHGSFVWEHSCPSGALPSACTSVGTHEVFTVDPLQFQVLDFGVDERAPDLAQFGAVGHVAF